MPASYKWVVGDYYDPKPNGHWERVQRWIMENEGVRAELLEPYREPPGGITEIWITAGAWFMIYLDNLDYGDAYIYPDSE
jgi:hypothetical protein